MGVFVCVCACVNAGREEKEEEGNGSIAGSVSSALDHHLGVGGLTPCGFMRRRVKLGN